MISDTVSISHRLKDTRSHPRSPPPLTHLTRTRGNVMNHVKGKWDGGGEVNKWLPLFPPILFLFHLPFFCSKLSKNKSIERAPGSLPHPGFPPFLLPLLTFALLHASLLFHNPVNNLLNGNAKPDICGFFFPDFSPSLLGYPIKKKKRAICFFSPFFFTIVCVIVLSVGAAPLSHAKHLSRHQISLRPHSTPNASLWLWPKNSDIQVTIAAWPFYGETASPARNGSKGVRGVLLKSISESNTHILWGASIRENRAVKESDGKKSWRDDKKVKCVVLEGYEEETAKWSGCILDCNFFHFSVRQSGTAHLNLSTLPTSLVHHKIVCTNYEMRCEVTWICPHQASLLDTVTDTVLINTVVQDVSKLGARALI